IFRQDAVLYKTDHTILRILVKFSWHIPDFPIYSNGTKPGTLQSIDLVATQLPHYSRFTRILTAPRGKKSNQK
ncbi:hypothetical protein ACL1CR_06395, partial [Corynebacterium striatum]